MMTASATDAPGLLLGPGPAGSWDSERVSGPRVLRGADGLWRMWYYGRDPLFDRAINLPTGRIGLATSRDGLHWQRVEGPHRGALLDVGRPGEFDMVFCGWPQVVAADDGWRLYYHTLDPRSGFRAGVARSDDGLRWRKHGAVFGPGAPGGFDAQGAATRTVVRHAGRWLMFYEGVGQGGYRSIGLAVSDDGLAWRREPGPEPDGSVFAHAPKGSGRWDAYAIGTPCVLPIPDGTLRMYYIGSNEVAEAGGVDELALRHQIGLAVCDGRDPTRWRRHGE